LNLSEQFVISNVFGNNYYCEGGDFVSTANFIAEKFKTVETASNYPYEYEKHMLTHYQGVPLQIMMEEENYLMPFAMLPNTLRHNEILQKHNQKHKIHA